MAHQRNTRTSSDSPFSTDLIIGHGWCKCGYKFTKPPEEKKVDAQDVAEPDMNSASYAASTTAKMSTATSNRRCTSTTTGRSSNGSHCTTCSSILTAATRKRCAGSRNVSGVPSKTSKSTTGTQPDRPQEGQRQSVVPVVNRRRRLEPATTSRTKDRSRSARSSSSTT